MRTYRNVIVAEDGSLEGERTLGTDRWIRFRADRSLLHISEAMNLPGVHEAVWALQDGYGEPGHTPPQGYDWSGIRDSSAAAIEEMLAVAKASLSDVELDEILGLCRA